MTINKNLVIGILIGALGGGTIAGVHYLVDIAYINNGIVASASIDDNSIICHINVDLDNLITP